MKCFNSVSIVKSRHLGCDSQDLSKVCFYVVWEWAVRIFLHMIIFVGAPSVTNEWSANISRNSHTDNLKNTNSSHLPFAYTTIHPHNHQHIAVAERHVVTFGTQVVTPWVALQYAGLDDMAPSHVYALEPTGHFVPPDVVGR